MAIDTENVTNVQQTFYDACCLVYTSYGYTSYTDSSYISKVKNERNSNQRSDTEEATPKEIEPAEKGNNKENRSTCPPSHKGVGLNYKLRVKIDGSLRSS